MTSPPDRVFLTVLDSVGVGELPDADAYGDRGSDTLGNISRLVPLSLPTLRSLGLPRVANVQGMAPVDAPLGAYGRMAERSPGKDSVTGHWEMTGIVLDRAFPTFPDGFPAEVIAEFEKRIGRRTIGNYAASGTTIIDELGPEHMRTGHPIVYTSADSVFQIAAHEEMIPIPELYRICRIAYELVGEWNGSRPCHRQAVHRPRGSVQAHRQPPRLRAPAGGDDPARRDDGSGKDGARHRQDPGSVRRSWRHDGRPHEKRRGGCGRHRARDRNGRPRAGLHQPRGFRPAVRAPQQSRRLCTTWSASTRGCRGCAHASIATCPSSRRITGTIRRPDTDHAREHAALPGRKCQPGTTSASVRRSPIWGRPWRRSSESPLAHGTSFLRDIFR